MGVRESGWGRECEGWEMVVGEEVWVWMCKGGVLELKGMGVGMMWGLWIIGVDGICVRVVRGMVIGHSG